MSDSFRVYRNHPDEIMTSDEEDSPKLYGRASRSRFAANESNVDSLEISDSSESEAEPIIKSKKTNKLRIISDSDDDEDESGRNEFESKNMSRLTVSEESGSNTTDDDTFEKRALSPRTRMSITGFRPSNISDDDSDLIDDSSDEDSIPSIDNEKNDNQTNRTSNGIRPHQSTNSPFTEEEEEELHSFYPEGAASHQSLNRSNVQQVDNSSVENSNRKSEVLINTSRNSFIPSRMSTHFNSSISNKLSSTMVTDSANKEVDDNSGVVCLNSPSITILPIKGETIELGSSSDSSLGSTSTPTKDPSHRKIQPEIIDLVETKPENKNQISSSEVKYVSKEYYESKLKKLSELKSELSICENLVNTLSSKLPDKGKRMSGRGDRLRSEIKELDHHIATLKVEVSFQKEQKPLIETIKEPHKFNAPSWDELTNAANSIQPTHTGKVGMANFIAQKTMTIERLKDIHGSLETCPSEDELADDPKYLKITLMNHQRHALAWMYWREKQKPHGGILADDMGLGKTLTMISLVLASNQRKEQEEEGSSSGSSDSENENPNSGWSEKGKRQYHYGGTLIICPASLIKQWEGEVENRVKRSKITVCVYHGNNREARPRSLAKYDMVVTTYNLLARECKSNANLYAVKWERIILDEAHIIRNHKSQASEAACKLKGKYRWALTGTPIQNREMDLFALMKFLKCSPFDELPHWKRWIDSKSAGGQQRLNTLMKSLMLRRTKEQLQLLGSLSLPEKKIELVEVSLHKDEMAVYQKVMLYSRSLFAQFLHQRAEKNNDLAMTNTPTFLQTKKPNEAFLKMHQKFARLDRQTEVKSAEILVLLLRLRQICCHPGLIDAMLEDEDSSCNNSTLDENHQEIDLLEQLNHLQINDGNSSTGLSESLNTSREKAISKVLSKALLKSNPVFNFTRLSSKFKKVIDIIETKIGASEKALIISQWTSVLQLLKTHLSNKGINTVSLNGSVPVKDRNGIVNEFNNPNSSVKIMLLSLTAGGVGLNLVGANHLLMIDLHWNPQLEAQAQDRIYRVGQKKVVHIYKFMCKETVEERIKALQDQKLAIANGVLTGVKSSEGSKLSIDDLKGLFGL